MFDPSTLFCKVEGVCNSVKDSLAPLVQSMAEGATTVMNTGAKALSHAGIDPTSVGKLASQAMGNAAEAVKGIANSL